MNDSPCPKHCWEGMHQCSKAQRKHCRVKHRVHRPPYTLPQRHFVSGMDMSCCSTLPSPCAGTQRPRGRSITSDNRGWLLPRSHTFQDWARPRPGARSDIHVQGPSQIAIIFLAAMTAVRTEVLHWSAGQAWPYQPEPPWLVWSLKTLSWTSWQEQRLMSTAMNFVGMEMPAREERGYKHQFQSGQ